MTDQEQRAKWQHDEKRWKRIFGIVVSIFIATAGHFGTGVWWASGITQRVAVVEARHQRLADRTDERATRNETNLALMQAEIQADRIANARQEQKLETVIQLLEEMRTEIQRMMQRGRP